jgi:hypothetical protein
MLTLDAPALDLVLLAANALQPAITGPDGSLPGRLIVIVVLSPSTGASRSCAGATTDPPPP